jgi:hypothetical protein
MHGSPGRSTRTQFAQSEKFRRELCEVNLSLSVSILRGKVASSRRQTMKTVTFRAGENTEPYQNVSVILTSPVCGEKAPEAMSEKPLIG